MVILRRRLDCPLEVCVTIPVLLNSVVVLCPGEADVSSLSTWATFRVVSVGEAGAEWRGLHGFEFHCTSTHSISVVNTVRSLGRNSPVLIHHIVHAHFPLIQLLTRTRWHFLVAVPQLKYRSACRIHTDTHTVVTVLLAITRTATAAAVVVRTAIPKPHPPLPHSLCPLLIMFQVLHLHKITHMVVTARTALHLSATTVRPSLHTALL